MYDCIPQKSFQTVVCGLELFNRQAAETVDIANFRWNGYVVRKLIKKYFKSDFQEAKFSWIYVNLHIYELNEYEQNFWPTWFQIFNLRFARKVTPVATVVKRLLKRRFG